MLFKSLGESFITILRVVMFLLYRAV